MDLFDKLLVNRGPIGKFSKISHGYYTFPKLKGEIGPKMYFMGNKVLNWSLNNYLGLANHPVIREYDIKVTKDFGLSYPMGSRMMSGNSDIIEELESNLSDFIGKEDTVVLNYGYQGIMSLIDCITSRNDAIVYDSECHACIIDGMRLSFAKRYVFTHNDIDSCKTQLENASRYAKKNNGGVLVITEGVFGMFGDMGILKDICDLKDKYSFRFLVDDAHGFGVMGKEGRGAPEELGVMDKIDIYFSTFAKSIASIGAFACGDKQVIEYLRYNNRSQIFSKTLPMPIVLSNIKRLELLRSNPKLRKDLWKISNSLQESLREENITIGNTQSPVTPIMLDMEGNHKESLPQTVNLLTDLRNNYNIFCSMIIYPVVPKNIVMLRLIPTANHSMEDVKETIEAFKHISRKLKSGDYKKEIYYPNKDEAFKF